MWGRSVQALGRVRLPLRLYGLQHDRASLSITNSGPCGAGCLKKDGLVCASTPGPAGSSAVGGLPRDPIAVAAAVTIRPAAPPLLTPALPTPPTPPLTSPGKASRPPPGPQTPAETLRLQGAPLRKAALGQPRLKQAWGGPPSPDLETVGEGVVLENGRGCCR